MIHYALKCDEGHAFDSWFQSAGAFDTLAEGGHLSCAICGSGKVHKAIMAPRVSANAADETRAPALRNAKPTENESPLAALRREVEANSEDVGRSFAKEARAMHLGETPARAIHGEARPAEARALLEEGVPVLPLPFIPKKKLS